MQIVMFAGAGFSAPFGLPTMNSFFAFAQNSARISNDEKAFIDQLLLEARGANAFLQTSATNLEDVLSLAVMEDRLDLKDKQNRNRGPSIRKILGKIYSDPGDLPKYWDRHEILKRFLGFDLKEGKHSLSIVTTNYDINIESAFLGLGHRVNPIIKALPIPNSRENSPYGHLYSPNGIALFKLHGSINWYQCDTDSSAFYVDGGVVSIMYAPVDRLPNVCASNHSTDLEPVIVPPSFMKPEFQGPMRAVWGKSALTLGQAEVLAFVGYSFPQSDIEMKFFLASSLVHNPRLRKILIVDPNAGAIVERLKNGTSGFGPHFRDMLVPISKGWTEAKLDLT